MSPLVVVPSNGRIFAFLQNTGHVKIRPLERMINDCIQQIWFALPPNSIKNAQWKKSTVSMNNSSSGSHKKRQGKKCAKWSVYKQVRKQINARNSRKFDGKNVDWM